MEQNYCMYFVIMALLSGLISSQTCNNALCKRRDIAGLKVEITDKMNVMESELEDKISEVRAEVRKMSSDISGVKDEVVKLSDEISKLGSNMKKHVPEDDRSTFESKVMDRLAQMDSKLNMMTVTLPNKDCRLAKDGTSTILTRSGKHVTANCDDGWLVIAHRFNGKEIFHNRTWNEYKNGFGSPRGEYFLGFDAILMILRRGKYKMRFDLVGWDNKHAIAEYSTFSIGEESEDYPITVDGFSSTGASTRIFYDSMRRHNHRPFSTIDRDNEGRYNCPTIIRGAWWYYGCADSNLFSVYPNGPKCDGNYNNACMVWANFPGSVYLKEMKMKIKPAP
ncbi:unnamed protein product [Owenia fusiformis]|uniref:Uncharacterized protein n=1 Tax=Owenia fusiformis TaxID=6347 RepID=A0A8J1Y542_OWEFU|nr:unnamed protein product [Owenia fusiformis]